MRYVEFGITMFEMVVVASSQKELDIIPLFKDKAKTDFRFLAHQPQKCISGTRN